MENPNRKQNRLSTFDYSQEGCYFITLCTQNRVRLFCMEENVKGDLCAATGQFASNDIIHKWIREMQNKFTNIVIDKYVIMPDHLHMIIRIKERHAGRSLPDMMHFFKTMSTNEYIRGVKSGVLPAFDRKLWQKSYYEHIIRNQQDYDETWLYIENNPLKWLEVHGQEL